MHDDDQLCPTGGPVLLPEGGEDGPSPWAPEVVEAQALLLADVLRRAPRELRRKARESMRAAWIAVEAAREQPDDRAVWSCYRAGRDLERMIYEAKRIPLPERSWMRSGAIFTLSRFRTVRIRLFVAWSLIRDVERRFVEFGRENEPFRAWLWERVSAHLPPDQREKPGAGMREDYELVYGRKGRESE